MVAAAAREVTQELQEVERYERAQDLYQMIQNAVSLEVGASLAAGQRPPLSSTAHSGDYTTHSDEKTREAKTKPCREIKEKKSAARKPENDAPTDDSSGREKWGNNRRDRRELAYSTRKFRKRDETPPSYNSSDSDNSKNDCRNRCDGERRKREDHLRRSASPNMSSNDSPNEGTLRERTAFRDVVGLQLRPSAQNNLYGLPEL